MRILIAEDEAYLNRILEKVLTKAGYAVDSCADGQEALDYLESTDAYDAAILDIMMPRVDGLTVLRRIPGAGQRPAVLLLTARDAVESRVEGLDLGADDYLTKPFATQELLARLRALLRRGGAKQSTVLAVADLAPGPRFPAGDPGRTGNRPLCPGICAAGIHDAQRGHAPDPSDDRGACVEL